MKNSATCSSQVKFGKESRILSTGKIVSVSSVGGFCISRDLRIGYMTSGSSMIGASCGLRDLTTGKITAGSGPVVSMSVVCGKIVGRAKAEEIARTLRVLNLWRCISELPYVKIGNLFCEGWRNS